MVLEIGPVFGCLPTRFNMVTIFLTRNYISSFSRFVAGKAKSETNAEDQEEETCSDGRHYARAWIQGRTQGSGFGVKPPLELDILQKRYYLHKGD